MPAIEVVANLRALNQWAQESHIASEAEDPRRAPPSARSAYGEHSERGLSKSLPLSQLSQDRASVARSSTTTDISRGHSRKSTLELADEAGRSRDISRGHSRKGTLELADEAGRSRDISRGHSRKGTLELANEAGRSRDISRGHSRKGTLELADEAGRSRDISRGHSRKSTLELADEAGRSRDISRGHSRKGTLELANEAGRSRDISRGHSRKGTLELADEAGRSRDISRGHSRKGTLELADEAGRSRDISRSHSRKGTMDLPGSISQHSPSLPPALTDLRDLPASDPLGRLPKLLRQISTNTDADSQAPSAYDLALQESTSSTSRATATYANNQLVLVPQECAARQTPKMRKMCLGL